MECLGVIGGSSLISASSFNKEFKKEVVSTEFGTAVCHVAFWKESPLKVVYIQRHHLEIDEEYRQPRKINYHLIAAVCKHMKCQTVIGLYSVGSMDSKIQVGDLVVPDDYFNPFHILHLSDKYDAHLVPGIDLSLQKKMITILKGNTARPHLIERGTYVQSAGPRFETKAEIRFFSQFGNLIGMTGGNEAELINELRIPFAMIAIVDNMANGFGDALTLELFKQAQEKNKSVAESVVCDVLDFLAHETATRLANAQN